MYIICILYIIYVYLYIYIYMYYIYINIRTWWKLMENDGNWWKMYNLGLWDLHIHPWAQALVTESTESWPGHITLRYTEASAPTGSRHEAVHGGTMWHLKTWATCGTCFKAGVRVLCWRMLLVAVCILEMSWNVLKYIECSWISSCKISPVALKSQL